MIYITYHALGLPPWIITPIITPQMRLAELATLLARLSADVVEVTRQFVAAAPKPHDGMTPILTRGHSNIPDDSAGSGASQHPGPRS